MARLGAWMAVTVMVMTAMASATAAWSGGPQVPCFFIFGDSLVDNGNNNHLLTLARANYPPYGIDFPQGGSGRFNNGRTVVDVLAQLLGFRGYIPPHAGTRGTAILRGLNYASGASGIRDETGDNLGDHFSMVEQVEHFRTTVQQMAGMFRGNRTALCGYLNRCIFTVGMGSNDYLNNYFMPNMYSTSYEYNPKTYAALLLQDYERQLTALYELGARKVAIIGVGQIGCIPYELARYSGRANGSRCNERINKPIVLYNSGLLRLVERFNDEIPDANFVFVNTYESSKDLIDNAAAYGFEVIDKGCCGVGKNNGQITCLPFQQPCEDRSKYLFWDAFHPTEAANLIYARKAYASTSTADVYPMNIQQLAMA